MSAEHAPECVCSECLHHTFTPHARSNLCALCLRARDHFYHQPIGTEPPRPKSWVARLGSIKGTRP